MLRSVADPGFPRRGRQSQGGGGGANLLFDQIVPENCMEKKEIGPGGHASLASPLRSAHEILK